MDVSIIPCGNQYKIHAIDREILRFLKDPKDLANIYLKLSGAACFDDNDNIIIFYLKPESKYLNLIKTRLPDAFIFFVSEFINGKNIGIKEAYELIRIAQLIPLARLKMLELYRIIKWPSGQKGLDSFNAFGEFPEVLQQKVLDGKLPLKEALLFHRTFKNNHSMVFTLLPAGATYSENAQMIRNLCEYAVRENKTVEEVMASLKAHRSEDLREYIFSLRYPVYSGIKKKFEIFTAKIKLPEGVSIKYDRSFEKNEHELIIRFSNLTELGKRLNETTAAVKRLDDSGGTPDLFDVHVLFERKTADDNRK